MRPRRSGRRAEYDDHGLTHPRVRREFRDGEARIGIVAVTVAAISWILTLPPITLRTAVPSIVLGCRLAAVAGAVVFQGSEEHAGSEASRSSSASSGSRFHSAMTDQTAANVREVFTWSAVIASGLTFATPLIFAGARRDHLRAQLVS